MSIDDETRKHIDFALYRALKENPQITVKELFHIIASLRNWKKLHGSARRILDKSFEDKILIGPYLYCNSGIKITLFEEKDTDVEELEEKDSFGILLTGWYSYLKISQDNGGTLSYAELVEPSFPARAILESSLKGEREFIDHCFDTPGKLEPDNPVAWDDTDWNVYRAMRNPRRDLSEAAAELQIPCKTVEERFQKIVKDCKVFMGFFPLGYSNYEPLLITLRTDYETGIRKFLTGLDRSSWLLKVDDLLILYLFHTQINLTCLKFSEMSSMRLIYDINVGIPLNVDKEKFLFI